MDSRYLEVVESMQRTIRELQRTYDKAGYESFEDRKALNAIDTAIEKLEDAINDIKHYSKSAKVGYQYKLTNGKYAIDDNNYFSCGYPIEVWNKEDQEWQDGRVEYKNIIIFIITMAAT